MVSLHVLHAAAPEEKEDELFLKEILDLRKSLEEPAVPTASLQQTRRRVSARSRIECVLK
jgi:hypothetical protein